MRLIKPGVGAASLRARDFPAGTPLHAFFGWNEARRTKDRRYTIARDLYHLHQRFHSEGAGAVVSISHLAIRPVVRRRFGSKLLISPAGLATARRMRSGFPDAPAVVAAQQLVERLLASIGASEVEKHAAVFKAFEELSNFVDLPALAARRPRRIMPPPAPARRNI